MKTTNLIHKLQNNIVSISLVKLQTESKQYQFCFMYVSWVQFGGGDTEDVFFFS